MTSGQGYTINGKVTGLADSTWLYLRDAKAQTELDSVKLINGSFSMSGTITPDPKQVYIHTVKFEDYVSFWISNNKITMSLKAGAFKQGLILGSRVQDESANMSAGVAAMNKRADSLTKALESISDTSARKVVKKQLSEIASDIAGYYMDYVKNYPNSVIAANLLSVYCSTWGREKARSLYNGLSSQIRQTSPARSVRRHKR